MRHFSAFSNDYANDGPHALQGQCSLLYLLQSFGREGRGHGQFPGH